MAAWWFVHVHTRGMDRTFTPAEANDLLPEARQRLERVVGMTRELHELARAVNAGESGQGGVPEAKALEARIDEALGWFREEGIQVKGIAPALLDFPAELDGETVLLCWREGEDEITTYHPLETGYLGRQPLPHP